MTTQIVITTILSLIQFVSLASFLDRATDLKENIWIEWVVILSCAMFEYLIWK